MRLGGARHGFTLIEIMIALAVVSFGIAIAAKVSSSAMRSSRRGSETVDLGQRARLVSRQLRIGLRLAGEGSTGAIGVDPANPFWSTLAAGYDPAGSPAIPALSGADNIVSTAISGVTTPAWPTDAIQVVVPDPSTRTQTLNRAASGDSVMTLAATQFNCSPPGNLVYIVDHGGVTGAGKTQLTVFGSFVPGTGALSFAPDHLQFNASAGTEVSCARISTYFIALPPASTGTRIPWLMRSDLDSTAAPARLSGASGTFVYTNAAFDPRLLDAPGVSDLQIAYSFSSELASMPSGRTTAEPNRWAYGLGWSAGSHANPISGADPSGWFEARQVRFSMLVTNLRAVAENPGGSTNLPELAAENGAPIDLPVEVGRFRLTAGEPLASLRMLDKVLPHISGGSVAPY